MATRPIRIRGLDDFAADLARMRSRLERTEPEWQREAAQILTRAARGAAGARLAPSLRAGRGEVQIRPGGMHADAAVRFLGARRRSGWYGRRRYARSTTQHPRWIGASWGIGDLRIIGPAMVAAIDEVIDAVGDHYEDVARQTTFPD